MAILPRESIRIADTHVLHPFFHHRFDVGPIRLTSVAHAVNYRITVLQDDVKPAVPRGWPVNFGIMSIYPGTNRLR